MNLKSFIIIIVILFLSSTASAVTVNLNDKQRVAYVNDWDLSSAGVGNLTTKAGVDTIINELVYMQVDTAILWTFDYYLASEKLVSEGATSVRDYRALPSFANGQSMVQYFISQAHLNGIEVHLWTGVNIIAQTNTELFLRFGYSYTEKDPNGVSYCSAPSSYSCRMDIGWSTLANYQIGVWSWAAGYYDADGIQIEEPHNRYLSYSSVVRSKVLTINASHDITASNNWYTLLTKSYIREAQKLMWTEFFINLKTAIQTVNPDMEFSINEYYIWPSDHGMSPVHVASNGGIDWFAYQNAYSLKLYNDYLNGIYPLSPQQRWETRELEASTNIVVPVINLIYPLDGTYQTINPATLSEEAYARSSKYTSEGTGFFNYVYIFSRTVDGIRIRTYLHTTPPRVVNQTIPDPVNPPTTTNPSTSFSSNLKQISQANCYNTRGTMDGGLCGLVSFTEAGNISNYKYRSIISHKQDIPADATNIIYHHALNTNRSNVTSNTQVQFFLASRVNTINYTTWVNYTSGSAFSNLGGDWTDAMGTSNGNIPYCTWNYSTSDAENTEKTCDITNLVKNSSEGWIRILMKLSNELTPNDYLSMKTYGSDNSPYITYDTPTEVVYPKHRYGEGGDSWNNNFTGINATNRQNPDGYLTLAGSIDGYFGNEMPDGYSWSNIDSGYYSFANGFLYLNTSAGKDMYGTLVNAPRLTKTATLSGDWEIINRFDVISTSKDYETIGTILYENDTSFLWSGIQNYESYASGRSLVTVNQTSALIKYAKRTEISASDISYCLKVVKTGTTYTSSYSTDSSCASYTSGTSVTWPGTPTSYGIITLGGTNGDSGIFKEYYIGSNDYPSVGYVTFWENSTSGNVSSSLKIDTSTIGKQYNASYSNDGISWSSLGSATATSAFNISGTRYQNTLFIIGLFNEVGTTPVIRFIETTFVNETSMVPYSITSWGNSITNNDNLIINATMPGSIIFNVTASDTMEYFVWSMDGTSLLNTSLGIYNFSLLSSGYHTMEVYGFVAGNLTNIISWVLNIDEAISFKPGAITDLSSSYGMNWINFTWTANVIESNITDGYNLVNNIDLTERETTSTFYNFTNLKGDELNITVYGRNDTGSTTFSDGMTAYEFAHINTTGLTYNHTVITDSGNLTFRIRAVDTDANVYSDWVTEETIIETIIHSFTQIIMDWWE